MPRSKVLAFSKPAATTANRILEIKNFVEVENYVSARSLLVLDIDNTVAKPKQKAGSDEWFCAYFEREKAKSGDPHAAITHTVMQYDRVHRVSHVNPVEQVTPGIIQSMQNRNIDVLALTTRGGSIADDTIRQLAGIEVNFNFGKFKDQNFDLDPSEAHATRKSVAKSGIIFCSGKNKGNCLKTYLDKLVLHPDKIVFVDDKDKNLREVEAMAVDLAVPFVGLHYTHLADQLHVDLEAVDVQLSALDRVLTDEEAAALVPLHREREHKKPRLVS